MDWDKIRVFHAVAQAGSFTHAGEALNLSQSAVSRQISALEKSMEVTLFHRHARGLILTEQGELLYRTAKDLSSRLNMTVGRIKESTERPQGPLRVTTTVAFGSVWLTSRMKAFLETYPDIDMSLMLADDELDLSMRAADVAIRMIPPRQPDLIQRRLMTMRYHVFAAPGYLKKHGMPKTPQDLGHHRIIVYGEEAHPPVNINLNWLLEAGAKDGVERRPVLKVNSVYGIFRAVQSGLGIAAIPDYMSRESGNLVEVLPELRGPSFDSFFVYPEELRHSNRVAVFRDFLVRNIAEAGL
ncbi:MAG: LysR family transcriptional regulator [Rhodospirillales bacterium]|jgi:DNA-binding transcriptional LysR family regulator|nr:LysR family transcriptional regulator [Rhodospirillales bacterium]MDP6773453.1 LysR family transcriptional regulator [Rhodospirillales bacterium]